MATNIKPSICGEPAIDLYDDDCDCCDILTQKVEDIEDVLEEHDERITENTNNFSNYYDKQTIDAMIGGGGGGMRAVVVDELPAVGDPNTFYYVLSNDNALVGSAIVGTSVVGEQGKYEKWLYSNGQWHNIGADHIDFENYVSTTGTIKEYDEMTLKVPDEHGVNKNVKILGKSELTEIDFSALATTLVQQAMANYCPYEVGDIMFTATATNPSQRYSGTEWTQIQGRFIFGQDASHALDSTGGRTDWALIKHNHTVNIRTDQNVHAHEPYGTNTHFLYRDTTKGSTSERHHVDGSGSTWYAWVAKNIDILNSSTVTGNNTHSHAVTGNTGTTGGVEPTAAGLKNTNMPPYITKYIWQRTR